SHRVAIPSIFSDSVPLEVISTASNISCDANCPTMASTLVSLATNLQLFRTSSFSSTSLTLTSSKNFLNGQSRITSGTRNSRGFERTKMHGAWSKNQGLEEE